MGGGASCPGCGRRADPTADPGKSQPRRRDTELGPRSGRPLAECGTVGPWSPVRTSGLTPDAPGERRAAVRGCLRLKERNKSAR